MLLFLLTFVFVILRILPGDPVLALWGGRNPPPEVIEAARRITGKPIPIRKASRRPGDPESLVASSGRARREIGWTPRFPGLESILETAWRFARTHPHGYRS